MDLATELTLRGVLRSRKVNKSFNGNHKWDLPQTHEKIIVRQYVIMLNRLYVIANMSARCYIFSAPLRMHCINNYTYLTTKNSA